MRLLFSLLISGFLGCGGECEYTCQQQRANNPIGCCWGVEDEDIFEVPGFSFH